MQTSAVLLLFFQQTNLSHGHFLTKVNTNTFLMFRLSGLSLPISIVSLRKTGHYTSSCFSFSSVSQFLIIP